MSSLFEALGRLLVRRAVGWALVVGVAFLALGSGWLASGLQQEDDVLAFLPPDNPDIARFQEINRDFGALDVALIGVEVPDAFDGDFLRQLADTTNELQSLDSVEYALSLTTVQDFSRDPMGGIQTSLLVPEPPVDAAASDALRAHVLSREHIAGSLVSGDGQAVVIYAFARYGADPRDVAAQIRGAVAGDFQDATLAYGGAPFVSSYIFDTTQNDMARLTPWAVAAIVLVMLIAFRDVVGVVLGLSATGVGILVAHGAMALAGVPLNVVLGSMPVILFAVGSAYGIHVLSRYYRHARTLPPDEAVVRTLAGTGPTVFTAGLTTAAGLLSFLLMDIPPLRVFGLFTAIGILATLTLSLTFVPAVIALVGVRSRSEGLGALGRWMVMLSVGVRRRRVFVGGGLALLALAGGLFAGKVESRMDQAAFYDPGTEPALADAFFNRRFGGSQFIQVRVEGDMGDPHVLRDVRALADDLSTLDHVARVQHVADVVAVLNDAMEDQRRVPDTAAKVGLLYGFAAGQPSMSRLVREDRSQALIQVQVDASDASIVEDVLAKVEDRVAALPQRFSMRERGAAGAADVVHAQVWSRLRALGHAGGQPVALSRKVDTIAAMAAPLPPPPAADIAARVVAYLLGGEAVVEVNSEQAVAIAEAVALVDPEDELALIAALSAGTGLPEDDMLVMDLSWSLATPLAEARAGLGAETRARSVAAAAGLDLAGDARLGRRVASVMLDLDAPTVAVPDGGGSLQLARVVNGLPVMHRGLSRSVTRNQFRSLAFALGLVATILSIAFRSVATGLLATAPTALSLLLVFGGMGAMGIDLDIGTSMLASIIIGAGVDYAVHLVSAWYAGADEDGVWGAARAAARTGPAIWTNALMVAIGFFVLTLGDARPLRNVGGLTSAAMIVAAAVTFLTIPVLARRRRYSVEAAEADSADAWLAEAPILANVALPPSRGK